MRKIYTREEVLNLIKSTGSVKDPNEYHIEFVIGLDHAFDDNLFTKDNYTKCIVPNGKSILVDGEVDYKLERRYRTYGHLNFYQAKDSEDLVYIGGLGRNRIYLTRTDAIYIIDYIKSSLAVALVPYPVQESIDNFEQYVYYHSEV